MVDRSRPNISGLERSRPDRSGSEKSRPNRSIYISSGPIWRAMEGLGLSTVDRGDISKSPDWFFWLSVSSLEALLMKTLMSSLVHWVLTIGLTTASSVTLQIRAGM